FLSNLGFSLILFVVLFLSAPAIASFFGQPQLVPLTRVMGSVILINAFALIQRTLLVKRVDFKTQTKISFIAAIVSGAVGIVMALNGFGVWSLVGQQISRQLMNSIFLWVWARWYPSLKFSVQSFRELFGFGWKLLVSGLIDTLWREMNQVIIGKFYSASTLGQYTRAQQFTNIFSTNLTSVVQRVSYPVLSEISDEKERMKLVYQKIIKVTMLVTFCCMLGLAAIAEPMVVTLIGEQWLPAVPLLQILCFQMMLYPLHAINLNMLQVQGRSDLFLKLEIIKKIIGTVPLLLGIFINIYWMLWGSVVTGFISYYLNAFYSGRFLDYSIWQQVRDILPSFTVASVMAAAVYALSFVEAVPLVLLASQVLAGVALVVALCEIFRVEAYMEIKIIVMSYINKFRHGR
ncbi:MAG: lipopolysaccharide biosynthesis protein, partial [Lachnospiraceae bacterium]|nr:lipopolysaccharide biosynthesis protein [Lachnospiraceae bacterium]